MMCLFLLAVAGCGRSESDYEHYVHGACEKLRQRQDALMKEYSLGTWERYDWDQETQELVFSHQGEKKVIATIQFVGSYSSLSNTWRWAWANDTVLPGLKGGSGRVRELGRQHGWERLTTAQWPAEEQDGWDMTAVALDVLDAKGAYRSPDDDGLTFMVITDIRWAEGRDDIESGG